MKARVAAPFAVALLLTGLTTVAPSHTFVAAFLHDIAEPEIDALIDQLGSDKFAEREAAQKKLIDEAAESLANFQKIKKRLKEKGLASTDAEIVLRSKNILAALTALEPHYTCYEASGHNANEEVTLRSQFGLHTLRVTEAHELCLPTLKNPSGTAAEQRAQLATLEGRTPHQRRYRVEGDADPAGKRTLRDQFGSYTAEIDQAMGLLTPALKDLNNAPTGDPPADPHYLCFRFDALDGEVTLTGRRTQLVLREDIPLSVPTQLCVPVTKRRANDPTPPGTEAEQKKKLADLEARFPNLICRVDESGEDPVQPAFVKTQFASENSGLGLVEVFCGPAEKTSGTQGTFKLLDDRLVTVDNVIVTGHMTTLVNAAAVRDRDQDTLEEIPLQVTELELQGVSTLLGPVTLTLRHIGRSPFRRSLGWLEEERNATSNVLDLPPFTAHGSAQSFFDLFVEIVAPAAPAGLRRLHNEVPKRMRAAVSQEPPDDGETFKNAQAIPLVNELGRATPLRIGTMFLTPIPAPFCDTDRDDDIDRLDVAAIVAARGHPASHTDIRDVDFDGHITVNDARLCTLRCTKAQCVP